MPRHGPPTFREQCRLAEAMLAGREAVEPGSLLDLIHAINPTGRELAPAEARRRYALKSRLQSLLVRRFQSDLVLEPDDDPQVVGLRLRSPAAGDACHARIEELEDDARAWVRLQLDLGLPSVPTPALPVDRTRARAPRPDPGPVQALLEEARTHLASFDYEAARTALTHALKLSEGGREPAATLLDLLVDTLADDRAALELEPSLSTGALAAPTVRALLALAAARQGEPDRALDHLADLADPRAADAWTWLARTALDAGELRLASDRLRTALRLQPAHPDAMGLQRDLNQRLAEAARPEEAALEVLVASEDPSAETRARELLARFPESESARRALRTLEERRAKARVEALLVEADAAARRDDPAGELAALRELTGDVHLPAPRDLSDRIRSAQERLAARDAERTAQEFLAGLESLDRPGRMAGYLALPDPARARVRPALSDLDLASLEAAAARVRAKEAVAAVVALEAARSGDPVLAVESLEAHERALAGVPSAQELLAARRAEIAAGRQAAALGVLDTVRRAAATGDADFAKRLLSTIQRRDLNGALKEDARALEAGLARTERFGEAREAHARALGAGNVFAALVQAREALRNAPEGERARWEAEVSRLDVQVARDFRLVDVDVASDALAETSACPRFLNSDEVATALSPDGTRLFLVTFEGRWGFVREVDVASQRLVRVRVVRAPSALEHASVSVDDGGVWCIGRRGGALRLGLERHELLGWFPPGELLGEEADLGGRRHVPGTECLWEDTRGPGFSRRWRVLDLGRGRAIREVDSSSNLAAVPVRGEARMVAWGLDAPVAYDERGVRGPALPPCRDVRGVSVHPDDGSLLVLDCVPTDERRGTLRLVPSHGGPRELGTATRFCVSWLATSLDERVAVAMFCDEAAGYQLVALGPDGPGLTVLWRRPVPRFVRVAQDCRARRAVVYQMTPRGVEIAPLGRTPLPALQEGVDDVGHAPQCRAEFPPACAPEGAGDPARRDLFESEWREHRAEGMALLQRVFARTTLDAEGALAVLAVLRSELAPQEWRTAFDLAWARFGSDLRFGVLHAERLALDERWSEALQALGEPGSAHGWHVLGLARMHAGEYAAAREAFRSGIALGAGGCPLAAHAAYAECFLDLGDVPSGLPGAHELVRRVLRADRRAQSEGPAGVLEELDRPLVHQLAEPQADARLAWALMERRDRRAQAAWHMAMVLARLTAPNRVGVQPAPLFTHAWSRERMEEVRHSAARWLEGFGMVVG